jgi:hypothetical protein
VEIGHVSWRGGSWEVIKLTPAACPMMEDAYNLCNVIEIFYKRKITKTEKKKAFWSFQTPNGIGTIV